MKFFLAVVLACSIALPAYAFNPLVTEVSRPYEVVVLPGEPTKQFPVLGELVDYPVMYELTATEAFTLTVAVRQLHRAGSEPYNFSLIAVRQNDTNNGVSEVVRVNPSAEEWRIEKDKQLGLTFWTGPELSVDVASGTYRVEISTPENSGKYLLQFGSITADDGYFTTIGGIRTTQKFFGYSVFKLLTVPLVYYSLGTFFLILALYKTWRFRKHMTHDDVS